MTALPYGITITVVRPGKRDKYGDETPGTEHAIDGCAVYPRTSGESTDQRDTVVIGLTLLAPYGVDLKATDKVRLPDGTTYQVDGEPGPWSSPLTGWQPGVQAALERVTG